MSSIDMSLGTTAATVGLAASSVSTGWSEGSDNAAFAAILAALGAASDATEVAAKAALLVGVGVVDPGSTDAELLTSDDVEALSVAAETADETAPAAATASADTGATAPALSAPATALAASSGEVGLATPTAGPAPSQPHPGTSAANGAAATVPLLAQPEAEPAARLAPPDQTPATARSTAIAASTAGATATTNGNAGPIPGLNVAGLTAEVARLLDEPTVARGSITLEQPGGATRATLLPSQGALATFTAASLASHAALSAAAADAEAAMMEAAQPEASSSQPLRPSPTLTGPTPAEATAATEPDAGAPAQLSSGSVTAPTTANIGAATGLTSPATAMTPTALFSHVGQLAARGDGVHRISVTLAPEALGEVQVILQARGGEVEVELIARTAQGHALLADGSSELVRLLEQVGATDSKVVVRTPDEGFASMEGQPDSQAETGDDPQHARTRAQHPAKDGTTDTPPGGKAAAESLPDSIEPVAHTRHAGVDVTV